MSEKIMEVGEIHKFPVLKEIDDDSSTASTENQLLSSNNSSQTITYKFKTKKHNSFGSYLVLISAIVVTLMGLMSIIWTPFDILMNERLRMLPGLPPYEWWKNPPDEVYLRVYIFNITNKDEFLSGNDSKLRLQEIGPIVFLEKLTHSNVTHNDNGTLTYVAKRTAIYLPELNTIDLDLTLQVPNLAILGMASYLWDASFFTKFGYNLLLRNLQSEPIVQTTISNYLWNFSDPILDVAQTIVPSLVPVKNMGILSRIYSNFEDTVTVYVGPKNGHHKFFLIDKYDGSEYLPGLSDTCNAKVVNSTEGVAYEQFLTKQSVLRYWRKTMCKVTPLYYERTIRTYGLDAYKFVLPNTTYDRTSPSYLDCYLGRPDLPNGLTDVSKCFYEFPMAASFPHFLYGDDILHTYVDGLEPNELKHESFAIVEPTTGIPIESRARSQSNLVVKKLSGFNEVVDKFDDTIIPMFWAEYNQVGLPWYIYSLIYFTVVILPHLQKVITAMAIIVGLLLIKKSSKKLLRKSKTLYLLKNKRFEFKRVLLKHK